jgi:thiamine phosphate synthase YjbQ (UPF0047 family)
VLTVLTGSRAAVHDLTPDCRRFLAGLPGAPVEGLLHVFVPHATAGVAVLELGAGSDDDLLAALADLLPQDDRWRHRHGARGHGRDHVMPALVPPYASIPVLGGEMASARGSRWRWSTSTSTTRCGPCGCRSCPDDARAGGLQPGIHLVPRRPEPAGGHQPLAPDAPVRWTTPDRPLGADRKGY